jgi:hypothetical protein
MLPNIKVFLDGARFAFATRTQQLASLTGVHLQSLLSSLNLAVDDLQEGRGAESVDASQVVLVLCTRGYCSSPNCMRELLHAVIMKKPIVALFEPDAHRKGGLTQEQFRQELMDAHAKCATWGLEAEIQGCKLAMPTAADLCGAVFANEPIEWSRVGVRLMLHSSGTLLEMILFAVSCLIVSACFVPHMFQDVSMRLIAQRVLPDATTPCFVTGELAHLKLVMSPPREGRHHVYCSQNNAGAIELLQEAQIALQVELEWTSSRSELASCARMLIYLDGRTWTSGEASDSLADEVREAIGAGVKLTLVHEMRGQHGVSSRRSS